MHNISLILTSTKNPSDCARVLSELNVVAHMDDEIINVGHTISDFPDDYKSYPYVDQWLVNPVRGCARSVHYAAERATKPWFGWFCDDHIFPDKDWLVKARLHINQGFKLIAFDDDHIESAGNWAAIGIAEVEWFLKYFPKPIFRHYGWDNAIFDLAMQQGLGCYADEVKIIDPKIRIKRKHPWKKKDLRMYHEWCKPRGITPS